MLNSPSGQLSIFLLSIALCAWCFTASVHSQVDSNDGFPPTVRTESNMQWKVTGKVTGPGGIPIPGAKVYLSRGCVYRPIGSPGGSSYCDFSEPAKASVTGDYKIDVREKHRLMFVAPGFAPLNVPIPDGSGLDVQFEPGRTISGTILLTSGEPAVGVKVSPVQWLIPKPQSEIDKVPPQQAKNYREHYRNNSAGFTDFGASRAAITDNEGHFSIARLPTKYRVGFAAKIPGAKEEIVYVQAEQDSGNLDFESQILEENEFTYQTTSCAVLNIQATNAQTGQPSQIATVRVQPISDWMPTKPRIDGRSKSFNGSSVTLNMTAYPNGSIAYIEPKDTNLLGIQLELPPTNERDVIERKVEFQTGNRVQGKVVSEETGEPISGVRMRWRGLTEMKQIDEKGNYALINIVSDRDGKFAMAVPDVDGVVGVMGPVPGYSSVTNWNERELYEEIAPQLLDEFTRILRTGDQENADIEFRLRPSFRLEIDVVRDGQPVPNCVVKGERRRYGDWSSSGYSTDYISEVTDEQGHAVVDYWYDNSFLIAKSRHEATLDWEKQPFGARFTKSPYPTKLQAFTDDGFNQGVITVPLPEKDPESYVIPLTIELKDPPSVLGRIVDTNGNGIGDLELTASLGGSTFSAAQTWKTKTKPGGWFKMQGLSFGDIKWSLDPKLIMTKGGNGNIAIDTGSLDNGRVLEIPSIECLDLRKFANELPDIDLTKLSNEDAVAALEEYIQSYITKIPDGPKRIFLLILFR